MSAISQATLTKNLNLLVGATILDISQHRESFRITLISAKEGKEIILNEANAFGLKKNELAGAIVKLSVATYKHRDDCTNLSVVADHVAGTIVRKVNVYAGTKGDYSNRVTLSFQLAVPDTSQTPGLCITADFISQHPVTL